MAKTIPFIFGGATKGDNFTDRVVETARLKQNFENGVNTVIISPRRWGKTSLVAKVADLVNGKEIKVVRIDIFSCRTQQEFYTLFANEVLKQTASKFEEIIKHSKKFLSNVIPKITIANDSQSMDCSVQFQFSNKEDDVDEILQLPYKIAKAKGIRIVVCLDEFQQIAEFDDSKTFQKKLRGVWQLQMGMVSYCLYGSKKHLMNELFEKKSLPFYKFCDAVYLPKISTEDWVLYICSRFEATGKTISVELARELALLVDNHSSYVQQLSWILWVYTQDKATRKGLNQAVKDLLAQNAILFEKQVENLTSYQLNFLRAVISGMETGFTASEVISKFNLGSSANITIIKKALVKKEIIEVESRKVSLCDPVMGLWLRNIL